MKKPIYKDNETNRSTDSRQTEGSRKLVFLPCGAREKEEVEAVPAVPVLLGAPIATFNISKNQMEKTTNKLHEIRPLPVSMDTAKSQNSVAFQNSVGLHSSFTFK